MAIVARLLPEYLENLHKTGVAKSMNWRGALVSWLTWMLGTTIFFLYIIPLTSPSTEANPAGNAGGFAALTALCVALLALVRTRGSTRLDDCTGWVIGLGSIFVAHLWFADATGVHPLDLSLPATLLLAISPGVLVATAAVCWKLFNRKRRDSA